jgi:hypothetical protein
LHESLKFLFYRSCLVQVSVRLSQELKIILKIIKNVFYGFIALYRCILIQILGQVRLKTSISVILKIRGCPCDLFWDYFEYFLLIKPFIIGLNKKTNEHNIFRKRFSVTDKGFRFFYLYYLFYLFYGIGDLYYGCGVTYCASD